MKCPFRTDRIHTSNGYNSSDRYEFGECYENDCPFYKEKYNKGECKRTEITEIKEAE